MQRTQFYAKSAKNDLKPRDFLKRNFYFETEGVCDKYDLSISFWVTWAAPMAIL